jgi:hypothetical protein
LLFPLFQIEHFAGIQDAVRVPGILELAHELDRGRAELVDQFVALARR